MKGIENQACPRCGDECYRDEVDVGVGVIYGPYGCPFCGWSEDSDYDSSSGMWSRSPEWPGRYLDQFGTAHSVSRKMEGTAMSLEAGVLVDLNGDPLHWHVPADRSGGYLPDNRDLWDIIWEKRDQVLGFAHSHPGTGNPSPSYEDVTTFAAVEAALGKRLIWWIISANALAEFRWKGPEIHNYGKTKPPSAPVWLEQLRRLSAYMHQEEQHA